MNFRQLRYFCEVADSGTLARAAQRLFVAPTAISMQISQLEEGLGGALFDRAVKPMTLTPLGRFFLPRARELLADRQRLEEDTRDVASGKSGWLGIGFVRSLLNSVLPAAVRAFRLKHPDVKLDLVELLSEHQPAHLRSGRIHIGLSRFAEQQISPPADLRHVPLFDDPFVVAVPTDHRGAKRGSVSLAELSKLPLISYPKDPQSSFAQHVLARLHEAGVQPRVGHEAIEIHTALSLVAAGLGYAVVGASVAQRAQSDVAFVRLAALKACTSVVAVTRVDEEGPLVASMLKTLLAPYAR
ncbi:DNA-binding transcriptional LysR family regulator [Variovorax boronicumulans]|uniref:LysR family transcriptional regulator n=1 Tax=Variovorax boronicumulans TaxID=436515 RepID=UPI0027846261|nr:LysR family transcriptional regulator [Variovorax boronicumulans]MDQ0012859.1 DNA-binding transcriptional LysR family regulator [Variovorax boronicumulans]